MMRIAIPKPVRHLFDAVFPVRVADVNYGAHVGNDAILRFCHDARLTWLREHGLNEADIGKGMGLIMVSAAVRYRRQAFLHDTLTVSVGVGDVSELGFDLIYTIRNAEGDIIAQALSGLVFFDYTAGKTGNCPASFHALITHAA